MYNADDAVARVDSYIVSVAGAGRYVGERRLVANRERRPLGGDRGAPRRGARRGRGEHGEQLESPAPRGRRRGRRGGRRRSRARHRAAASSDRLMTRSTWRQLRDSRDRRQAVPRREGRDAARRSPARRRGRQGQPARRHVPRRQGRRSSTADRAREGEGRGNRRRARARPEDPDLQVPGQEGVPQAPGHRSELTRLEVIDVKQLTRKPAAKKARKQRAEIRRPSRRLRPSRSCREEAGGGEEARSQGEACREEARRSQSRRRASPPRSRRETQMAHKKGLGSSRNGRDSNPKMLGVKVFAGQRSPAARSSCASAAPGSVPATAPASAATTRSSRPEPGTVEFKPSRKGRVVSVVERAAKASDATPRVQARPRRPAPTRAAARRRCRAAARRPAGVRGRLSTSSHPGSCAWRCSTCPVARSPRRSSRTLGLG